MQYYSCLFFFQILISVFGQALVYVKESYHSFPPVLPPKQSIYSLEKKILQGAIARCGSIRLCHDRGITSLMFSPCGRLLASAGCSNNVFLWNVDNGEMHEHLTATESEGFNCLSFSPNCKYLAAADSAKGLWVWQLAGGKPGYFISTTEVLSNVSFSQDNKLIASVAGITNKLGKKNHQKSIYSIYLWDVESGMQVKRIPFEEQPIYCFTSIWYFAKLV